MLSRRSSMTKPKKRPKTIKVSTIFPLKEKLPPKRPNPTFKQNLKAYLAIYCNTTTIHGVKYIGEKGRYLVEKLAWFCIVVTVCFCCTILISKTYQKWLLSPVIVSFETKETPIFEIPFPAVTVCPEVKINPIYFNISEYLFKRIDNVSSTEREDKLFASILFICDAILHNLGWFKINNLSDYLDGNVYKDLVWARGFLHIENETTIQFLRQNVEEFLVRTITEEGVCYTFNMLPLQEILKTDLIDLGSITKTTIKRIKWNLEDGYLPGDNMDCYPKRTFLSGLDGGLVIDWLYVNRSQVDYICKEGVQGFKVALHHPAELPNMDKVLRLPLNQAVLVSIKPIMITVSKELRSYNFRDRKCYFPEEKFLFLYKFYTQQNCLTECLYNYTYKSCGCVTFWMPHFNGTKICGPGKNKCVEESKINFLGNKKRSEKHLGTCRCLPSCASLTYDVETSPTNWNWRELHKLHTSLNVTKSTWDPDASDFSKLIVYYKDLQFLSYRRHELYGVVDFFSNVGGLLGLFIGFSVISAIEIIHFMTLRIACNIKKYGREFWSGEPDLINS